MHTQWSGKELANKWEDALKSGNLYSSPPNGQPPILPEPLVKGVEATIKHLETTFKPDEIVSLGNFVATEKGKKVVQGPSVKVSDLITELRAGNIDLAEEIDGVAIRINPFVDLDSSRDADQISSFRHILIDFDLGTPDEQFNALQKLALPVSVVVFSGKAGIHAMGKSRCQR